MIKLHIGCGWRNFGNDWVHIDGGDYEHLKYKDITKLEFKDNSVDLIYASHVISYFDREEILILLKEWKRVLKPSGILRLAVPDFGKIAKLYNKGWDLEYFLGLIFGRMKMGENYIYHKTTYDLISLRQLLKYDLGFDDIEIWDFNNTAHRQFDDHSKAHFPNDKRAIETGIYNENQEHVSLNIQCRK